MFARNPTVPVLEVLAMLMAAPARAQEVAADSEAARAALAKKLANPIASLISVPLQYNYDTYGGANNGARVNRLNI
jgi:hypothetical protein